MMAWVALTPRQQEILDFIRNRLTESGAEARSGQIVVARLEDEVTVKRLQRRGSRVDLMAEAGWTPFASEKSDGLNPPPDASATSV